MSVFLTIVTWAVIAGGMLAILYMLGVALQRFPGRTIDDVAEYLRPVDLGQVQMLLDPGADYSSTCKLDPETLCEVRRKRIQMYLELLARMAHNARVLVEFGNREARRLEVSEAGQQTVRQREAIAALQFAAVSVRIYAVFAIVMLWVLLVIRPLQAPSLTRFRKVVDVDGIQSYEALRQTSAAVFEEFRRSTEKLLLNF